MRKSIKLYLAGTEDEVGTYRKVPVFKTVPAVPAVPGQLCDGRCGNPTCSAWVDGIPARPAYRELPRNSLFSFCPDGLRRAGIRVKDGEVVELTISVKPLAPKKPKAKKSKK